MRLALREAWKGLGRTSPNPMVGAVIVHEGKVVARGHHAVAGGPHAEIVALNNLASLEQACKATLYITLEPCSTHGRTPPCTDDIVQAGFARVVYGATDPNPQHQGRAKNIFEAAGISVTTGILAEKCTALNHAWNHRMKTGMPWVIAKCGMSLDGHITSPDQRWITSEASRHHAMLFRRRVDAILIGGNTVRCDNPYLTIRGLRETHEMATNVMIYGTTPFIRKQPWRVVWTRSEKNIPKDAHLLQDAYRDKTIIYEHCTLREALQNLALRGISSVLIEGGGITLGKAFEDGLVDEVRFYIAPLILGKGTFSVQSDSIHPPLTLKNLNTQKLHSDLLITALVAK